MRMMIELLGRAMGVPVRQCSVTGEVDGRPNVYPQEFILIVKRII